jgi:hypothetical protein
MTVVSGTSPAMIPSAAKGPRWASVNSTRTCAAAESQLRADTQGGDSPACRSPSTAVTVNKMVGTPEARNVSQSAPAQRGQPGAGVPGCGVQASQPERCADGHHGLGHYAAGQGHAQQTPAGVAFGDQAGEHGEERRQQHRAQHR